MKAKIIYVNIPPGKHCPICGKDVEEVQNAPKNVPLHSHKVKLKDARRLDVITY